ncbi:MAG: 4-hydroxy-tetrahydrodipicolinate reductase [Nitrospirota bacterium]|nr:4-hydroxy-tetrahydrodipicolinate reductase [Nitrospirota bacterium]
MKAVRVAITGAAGRMGQRLVTLAHQGEHTVVTGASEASGHGKISHDAGLVAGIGEIGVTISPDLSHDIGRADVVIDFSVPEASVRHARLAGEARVPMVIGTTGLSAAQNAAIAESLSGLPYVQAPNMSVGITLLLTLLDTAARTLTDEYDIEIVEMHHRHKIDAPSGTALRLGEVVARARGVDLEKDGVFTRHGHTGPRARGSIGLQTLRGGDVAGDHLVIFAADGERVEIGHRASGRDTFAMGAIRAACWVVGRAPGHYDMQDVLGLR